MPTEWPRMRNEVMSLEFSGNTIIPKVSAQTLWLAPGPAVHRNSGLLGLLHFSACRLPDIWAAGAASLPCFPACRLPDIWATCTAILGCLEDTRQSAAIGPYPVACWVPDVWLLIRLPDIQLLEVKLSCSYIGYQTFSCS